ncbi:DoxX family protein [Trinickia violacea]|uniref:DoxX family protein n=1 Tax=Trinickia violacea TaxID=2571746 RepID=A0A4P8ISA6_9BURK|nr:DoxX family protein [Trinickia violacea]QCP52038.1 DoxX family protein [Trinickia violacea]
MNTSQSTRRDLRLFAGRVLMAAVFVLSGIGKLASPYAAFRYIASFGLPAAEPALMVAMLLELACGTLLIVGYRTRWVSSVLTAYCIVTAFIFHHAFEDPDQMFHFLKNLAMAGGLLGFTASGAGAFSLDHFLGRISKHGAQVAELVRSPYADNART